MNYAQHANILIQALPYIQEYYGKTIVIKYGGNAMINDELTQTVINDIILMKCIGINPIIVHGGGPDISNTLAKMNHESKFINGLRYTDETTIKVAQMVLAGKVNKDLVKLIEKNGGKAIGLSGIDGGMIKATKLNKDIDLGYVGEITSVNTDLLNLSMNSGYIPVVSSIAIGEKDDNSYNINADTCASKIASALKASINQLPPANRVAANGFDEAAMDRLITIAAAYGTPTIYCTYEFAVRMIPQEAWRYTEAMKTELWNTGRLANYKGTKVIILEQGFEDETNTRKCIDPGYAWVIPTGADGKPVKVAFEGGTIVDEFNNYDRSREIQVYKKVGVTCILANNICAYCDTSLLGKMSTWDLDGVTGKVATYDGRKSGTLA